MIRMVPRYGTIRTVRDVACILKGILFFFVVFDSTGINTIPTLIRPDAVFRSFAYFCDGRAVRAVAEARAVRQFSADLFEFST